METEKYELDFIVESTLSNLLNEMVYNLKKVKRNKLLKKIKETDVIFDNVQKKREESKNGETIALLSVYLKDKVIIGPFSGNGKNRNQVESCGHELTNRFLISLGILDLKNDQPYFYNFLNKPTSLAIVDCIEDYISQNLNYQKIDILLDNGPDNSGVRTSFLKGLVDLSNKYQKVIELIYYPPYHSKYNPVERFWARLEKMWNGMMLTTEEIYYKVIERLMWKDILVTL